MNKGVFVGVILAIFLAQTMLISSKIVDTSFDPLQFSNFGGYRTSCECKITITGNGTSDGRMSGAGYLYNDTSYIYLNETKLNATIDARAITGSTDGRMGTEGQYYLYNDSSNIGFNETRLNRTIDSRASADGRMAGGLWYLYNDTSFIYLNDTRLNATIDSRDSDTDTNESLAGGGYYLYNDTSFIYVNETRLNNTIDSRVEIGNDGRMAGYGYLYNDTSFIYINETRLNATIDARDSNTDTNYSLIDNFFNITGENITSLDANKTYWLGNATFWWGKIYTSIIRAITGIFDIFRVRNYLYVYNNGTSFINMTSSGNMNMTGNQFIGGNITLKIGHGIKWVDGTYIMKNDTALIIKKA